MGTLKISDEGTVITQAHVHALTSLDARNAGIADLTGLGVFSSLERGYRPKSVSEMRS